jgi:hypothetical protein
LCTYQDRLRQQPYHDCNPMACPMVYPTEARHCFWVPLSVCRYQGAMLLSSGAAKAFHA